MRDLAKMAGVNESTVSRALSNHPRISEATRQKIQGIAKKAGFRPDPSLAALNTYSVNKKRVRMRETIAILRVGSAFPLRQGTELQRKVAGLIQRADELGYVADVLVVNPSPEGQKQLSRLLRNRGIRGMVICPLPLNCRFLDHIDWEHFSSVIIGNSLESPLLNYVAMDHRCDRVYSKLKELGYQRIGFCAGIPVMENNHRYQKLAEYLKCQFLDDDVPEQFPPLLYPSKAIYDPIPWLEAHDFDAVMTGDPLKFLDLVKRTPFATPKRLALAALALSEGDAIRTGISASVENNEEVGRAAIDLLHQNLCHGLLGVPRNRQAVLIESGWHQGRTTPKKSATRRPSK